MPDQSACAGAPDLTLSLTRSPRLQELFTKLGRGMSTELDEIVAQLLKKAGEVSTAGRDNFLAVYADAALGQMVISCSELRSINALVSKCDSPLATASHSLT